MLTVMFAPAIVLFLLSFKVIVRYLLMLYTVNMPGAVISVLALFTVTLMLLLTALWLVSGTVVMFRVYDPGFKSETLITFPSILTFPFSAVALNPVAPVYVTVVVPVNPYSNVMSPAANVESTLLTVMSAIFVVSSWFASGTVVTVSL